MKKSYIPIIVIVLGVIILVSLGIYYFTVGPSDDNSKLEVPDTIQTIQKIENKTNIVNNDVIEYSGEKYYKLETKYSLDNGNMTNAELAEAYLSQITFKCSVDKKQDADVQNENDNAVESNLEEVISNNTEDTEISTQTITLEIEYSNNEAKDFLEFIRLISNQEVVDECTKFNNNKVMFECDRNISLDDLHIEYGSYNLDYYMSETVSKLCN